MRAVKGPDLIAEAGCHCFRFGGKVEVVTALVRDGVQAFLDALMTVFKTKIKDGAFAGVQVPDVLALGNADTEIKHHPGLADLGRTAEDAKPLGE